jgi:hypothetical protein
MKKIERKKENDRTCQRKKIIVKKERRQSIAVTLVQKKGTD